MSYMQDNFLLTTKTAERLYNDYAKDMPIFDYHCHLPEQMILENRPFQDMWELWLSGDHYKWRLLRNYGVDEELITGSAPNKEKFLTYCKVLGTAFGNPLYHWSQLELKSFFDCDLEINEANAEAIWENCNRYIQEHNLTPQKVIEDSNVACLFTTNEIFDDLTVFEKIAEKGYKFQVFPAFRADKIMNIEDENYLSFVGRLGDIPDLDALEKKIEERLAEFIAHGTRACDIALQRVYPVASREAAQAAYHKRMEGGILTEEEQADFKGYLTYFLFQLYAKNSLVTELHIGAMRNNNSAMKQAIGADTGFDSIGQDDSIANISKLFDRLNSEGHLPKTILFNLHPKMNMELSTMIGNFQSSEAKGKMQWGAAWWFLDNKEGMEQHLKDLSTTSHLGAFLGMLTDSRSFISYPRHHYFRRILCSFLGNKMEQGEMTTDEAFVGKVVQDICFHNAKAYFGI